MDILVPFSPTLPTFFLLFLFVYLLAYLVIFRNWVAKHRAEASSSFMSLAHGTPAIVMTIHALRHTQSPPAFSSPNSHLHNRVLEFSIAYFLMDLLHYLVFFPHDILFILHHVATLYVLATCLYVVGHGAYGILGLLVLAEVTSGCQNVWSITRVGKVEVPAAARFYALLSPPFFAFYSLVRGILGPFYVFKMGVFYLSGGGHNLVPGWAWISWMVVISIAILVSISWVSNNWIKWYRQRREEQKKLR